MSAGNQAMRVLHAIWTPLILIVILTAFVAFVAVTGDIILARTVTDALIRMVMVVGLYIFHRQFRRARISAISPSR